MDWAGSAVRRVLLGVVLCGGLLGRPAYAQLPDVPGAPDVQLPPGVAPDDAAAPPPPVPEGTLMMGDVPPLALRDWRLGSKLYLSGTIIGLAGTAVGLAGAVATVADPGDPRLDLALSLTGAGLGGASVVLTATGLGLQHRACDLIGRDPGKGLYVIGTLVNGLGILGLGASIFLAATNYLPQPPSQLNNLPTYLALGSTVVMIVGSLVYSLDMKKVNKAWATIGTF